MKLKVKSKKTEPKAVSPADVLLEHLLDGEHADADILETRPAGKNAIWAHLRIPTVGKVWLMVGGIE